MTLPEYQSIPVDQIVPSHATKPERTFPMNPFNAWPTRLKPRGCCSPLRSDRVAPSPSMGEGRDGGGVPPPQSSPTRGEEGCMNLLPVNVAWRAVKLLGLDAIDAIVIQIPSEA